MINFPGRSTVHDSLSSPWRSHSLEHHGRGFVLVPRIGRARIERLVLELCRAPVLLAFLRVSLVGPGVLQLLFAARRKSPFLVPDIRRRPVVR